MFSMILSGLICGALLGFVMQRGRFCLTGGFRDMYIAKNNRMFYALLIAISVRSVGVFALIQAGLLTYEAGAFPWLGTVIGGYLFGLGIVLAGGCATGTWYRAGEGLIGSWWICPYISRHLLSLNPLQARCRRYSRGER